MKLLDERLVFFTCNKREETLNNQKGNTLEMLSCYKILTCNTHLRDDLNQLEPAPSDSERN